VLALVLDRLQTLHERIDPGFHILGACTGLRFREHIAPHRHVRLAMRLVAGSSVDELSDRLCRELALVFLGQLREIGGTFS
jgi:hypothetical protein